MLEFAAGREGNGRAYLVDLVAGEGPDEDLEKDGAARPQSPAPSPSPGNEGHDRTRERGGHLNDFKLQRKRRGEVDRQSAGATLRLGVWAEWLVRLLCLWRIFIFGECVPYYSK